eukprot:Nk52_evm7s287 gene=Nk52_evmTU7s287
MNGLVKFTSLALILASAWAYFDYQRVNDPEYKAKLKAKRKEEKRRALEEKQRKEKEETLAMMEKEGLIFPEEGAKGNVEYQQDQLVRADKAMNAQRYDIACCHFANAVKASEEPLDMVAALKQALPAELVKIVIQHIDPELLKDTYFEERFPEQESFEVKFLNEKSNQRCIVSKKSVSKGEFVFCEKPLFSVTNGDLEQFDFCFHCVRELDSENRFQNFKSERFYCSEECKNAAMEQYEYWLNPEKYPESVAAYKKLYRHSVKHERSEPIMAFKLLAQLLGPNRKTMSEHFGHLNAMPIAPEIDALIVDRELELLVSVFRQTEESLAASLNLEAYSLVLSKLQHNCIDIYTKSSGDGEELSSGKGFFLKGAYCDHSCDPNMQVLFTDGDDEAKFLALKDINEGDRLNFSYVSVQGKSRAERTELIKDKFGFACLCDACIANKTC